MPRLPFDIQQIYNDMPKNPRYIDLSIYRDKYRHSLHLGILMLSGLLLLLTILQLDFWIWAGYVALQTGHYPVVLTISFIAAMCNFHSPAYQ